MLYSVAALAVVLIVAMCVDIRFHMQHKRQICAIRTSLATPQLVYNPQICSVCDRVVVKHVSDGNGGFICSTCKAKGR